MKEFLTGAAEGSKIVITGYCKEGAGINSIEALLDPKTKYDFSVAPAVSIGGFGRSSLARHFFHDKEIQNQFELKMWVPEDSSMELIRRDILNNCGGNALAIRTLGSMLYFKSFRDWSSFRKELYDVSAQDGDIFGIA